MTTTARPRFVRNTDPHTPGFLYKQGRTVVGRILYVDFTRNYSCFVQVDGKEKWLGCADTPAAAKDKVTRAYNA